MKNISLLILLALITSHLLAQCQYDPIKDRVYCENILEFNEEPKNQLKEKIKEALAAENYVIRYETDDDIYASGMFPIIFHRRTKTYRCIYDIRISIKDHRIRYHNTNYYIIPLHIKLRSYDSWWGFGSTTKIPTEVNKTDVNLYWDKREGLYKKLFERIYAAMGDFENDLMNVILDDKDW